MESNKEEAEKCLNFAEKFFASGNNEKGIKFVRKSLHLFPTKKAEELLEKHEKNGVNTNGYVNANNKESVDQSNENEAEVHTATPEEIDEVKKITNCKDFYDVLGVSKEFTESELKKQYRKKALKFHPDKNRTPGADEAFKRIGNAFAVLNDPAKRRRYDEVGEDTGPELRRHHSHNDGFEGDISPEDLFNMFFGGGFPQGNNVRVHRTRSRGNQFFTQTTTNQRNQNGPHLDSSYYPLIQILPILLIVLFSVLSSFLIPEPLYSFQSTSQYRYSTTTSNLGILYFVKDKDWGEKRGSNEFQQLERQIEKTYVENLEVKCYRERQYQQELLHQARIWGNPDLRRRAQNFQLEACNQLSALGVR